MQTIRVVAYFLVILLIIPSPAFARHNTPDDEYFLRSLDTGDLDNDPQDEFPVPVLFGVAYEDINPDFGDLRGGGTRLHEGEDMLAPFGTPVVSPTEAVVVYTGRGSSAGNFVVTVGHGNEIFRYMHLDTIANLDRGDELDAGDLIGTVGDTGNAPDGVYHLHFEVRDDDNDPTDPYPRMTDTFTLKKKASFLRDILRDVREDEDAYAAFLVDTFTEDLTAMLRAEYKLPDEIEDALDDAGVYTEEAARAKIQKIIAQIPPVLQMDLRKGDQGPAVTLLQIYLIYGSEGPARDALAAATATGYYGPITAAAMSEFQATRELAITGVYDAQTRKDL